MRVLLLIGLGGFIGTISRYLLARAVQTSLDSTFPFGTLSVNIIGSLLIGIFYGFTEKGILPDPEIRFFLTVGICGGFTTFSAFSAESFYLIRDGQWMWFMAYALLSFSLCLLAVFLGFIISKNL